MAKLTIDSTSAAQTYVYNEGRIFHNCAGELPEFVRDATVPYECSSCLGKAMFEESRMKSMHGLLQCPYCGTRNIVDDDSILPPWVHKER